MDKRTITKLTKEALTNTGNPDRDIPSLLTRGKNFGKAVTKHVISGSEFVTIEEYERRISICNGCDVRNGRICTDPGCGCYLDEKAWWASESCPLSEKKW